MLKYILLFFLKRLIKILNFNKRFLIKFAPFKFLYFKIIALFLFIRTLFNVLKGYTIFKYLGMLLRLLSFSSLLMNFILFILLLEIDITGWTPAVKYYLKNSIWLPNSFTGWLLDLWYKLVWILTQIWNLFTEYLSYILSKILEILKSTPISKEPVIMPDKNKYGDIHNKEYINNITQTLDEYKIYIFITIGVIAIGILTYTYWDSIKNPFRKGDNGDAPDLYPVTDIPSPIPSDPSIGRDVNSYPEGYLEHFSNRLSFLTEKVKIRSRELFSSFKNREIIGDSSNSGISSNVSFPKGLYRDGNQLMWGGLPVPRVENHNGLDYFIFLDKDKYINVMDSTMGNHSIDLINPLSGSSIGSTPIPLDSKINFIRDSSNWPEFKGTIESMIHRRNVTNLYINNPSVSSTSVSEDTLPSFAKSSPIPIPSNKGKERFFDAFDDVQLDNRMIDVEHDNWPSNSTTPTQGDYRQLPDLSDFDNFT